MQMQSTLPTASTPTGARDPAREPDPESGAVDPSSSRIHLPPHRLVAPDTAYEGDTPNVLADHLLLRPPAGSRTSSWHSILRPSRPTTPPPPAPHHDAVRLPWWRTPSPGWFFPGGFLLALSSGMIVTPKLEIYTQLICRALPADRSHVTLPPPPIARLLASALDSGIDNDASWSHQCQKSSAVQASVAQLALVLALLVGLLSALTTGHWGAFSDRRGRKPVLLLALAGTVVLDSVFLLTVHFHSILTYNFLFLGPILDGLVGGWATAQAAVSAYISDCTPPGSRARVFSLLGGCLMGGFALGPLVGSALISLSGGAVLTPFYVALALHGSFIVLLAVVLPESLSVESQLAARERHHRERALRKQQDKQLDAEIDAEDQAHAGPQGRQQQWGRWRRRVVRRLVRRTSRAAAKTFGFLQPLALLLPREVSTPTTDARAGLNKDDDGELRPQIEWGAALEEYWHPEEVWRGRAGPLSSSSASNSGGDSSAYAAAGTGGANPTFRWRKSKARRDWSLTKIAIAYACNVALMAVMTVKLLYARTEFGWAPTTTGYFLSYMGSMRLLTLLVILPVGIKLLRRRPIPVPARPRPPPTSTDAQGTWDAEARWLKVVADSHFDLLLARLSLAVDALGFFLFLAAPRLGAPRASAAHTAVFLLAVLVQSLGSGASPALQSLALAHAPARDAGRLFASLSVVQALSAQVLSPVLFTAVFSRTVGKWDEAIFAVAWGLSVSSLVALGTVRLRRVYIARGGGDGGGAEGSKASQSPEGEGQTTQEEVGVEGAPEEQRGTAQQARFGNGGGERKTKSAVVPQSRFFDNDDDDEEEAEGEGAGAAKAQGKGERGRRGSWSASRWEPYRD